MAFIVVIEDNADNARMAAKLLRHAGHEVTVAEDGEMGLTTIFGQRPDGQRPDLVLLDLGLPDIDGQTVIGLVRQQAELRALRFIAFTAWPEDTAHNMARAYGCDGVITKPINTRTFAQQVADYLGQPAPPTEIMPKPVSLDAVAEADADSDIPPTHVVAEPGASADAAGSGAIPPADAVAEAVADTPPAPPPALDHLAEAAQRDEISATDPPGPADDHPAATG
jgi:two-component system cell cycle response regulator DivK